KREVNGFFNSTDALKELEKLLGAEKYAALKTKALLKPYQAKTDPAAQSAMYWPEDIEKAAEQ
ncbi:MAG TPA: hypothetical protein PKO06_09245, partial [Candidatus Ozemobacteraceae bacterium]|nr:hypothetical protein [Candidatus Ozemobacteraceae bacterium]